MDDYEEAAEEVDYDFDEHDEGVEDGGEDGAYLGLENTIFY
jgi:hypothetical protein